MALFKLYLDQNLSQDSKDNRNEMTCTRHDEKNTKISDTKDVKNVEFGRTPKNFDPKEFINKKFLVNMPDDFYSFWDLCKELNKQNPLEAFKQADLTLVGPYDVLAGKFHDVPEQPDENYLVHWRYFHDPPEFQTVLKGDEKTEFHIGYFRDSPEQDPVFLASNNAKSNGMFRVMGDNIFAAVYLYLDDLKKTGDPFKKLHMTRLQNAIKTKAEGLNLALSERTQKIRDRDKKIVARSFSKIGIVVPYNRKTQMGYRDLGVSNKELTTILDNITKASPDQKKKYLSTLQDVLTNVSIATDECDFGTGIELGLDIIAHGVDSLNQTAARFLGSSYRLIGRDAFAKIAEAHMKCRKKGTELSII